MLTEKDMKMYRDAEELKFKRWCRVNNKEESKESLMAYRKWQRESIAEAHEKVTIDIYLKTLSRQLEDNFEKYNQNGLCTLDNFFKGTDFEPYLNADADLKGVVNWNRTKEGDKANGKKKEEAKEYLYKISYDIGSTAIEYLSDKDGIKMREAIDILYSKEEV